MRRIGSLGNGLVHGQARNVAIRWSGVLSRRGGRAIPATSAVSATTASVVSSGIYGLPTSAAAPTSSSGVYDESAYGAFLFGDASSMAGASSGGMLGPTGSLLHRGLSAGQKAAVAKMRAANPKMTLKEATGRLKKKAAAAEKQSSGAVSAGKKKQATKATAAAEEEEIAEAVEEKEEDSQPKTKRTQPITRVKSEVVDNLMFRMVAKGFDARKAKGQLTEEERKEADLRRYVHGKRIGARRLKYHYMLDAETPIDHLSLHELYEYLFVALKGGEIQAEARRRIPMSMRMATGERSLEVPPPSFIYVLLQNEPNLLHESFHPRISYAVTQWLLLPVEHRQFFVDHPLKGICE